MTELDFHEATEAGAAAAETEPCPAGEADALEPDAAPDATEGVAPASSEPEAVAFATADDSPPSPIPSRLDEVFAGVQRLEAQVAAEAGKILQAFADKLALDGFREEQVERLHAELQQHREGMLERATRPLLNAVIRVHDDLGKVVASLRARPPEEITPERTFRVLDGFREDLELLLAQHGVEPFEPVDDIFDPRLHTALRTVHTGDPGLTGRIAERLRPGFSHGEALLQKARVAVFTAQGGPAPAAPSIAPDQTTTPTGEEG